MDRSPLHLDRKWNLSWPPLPTGNGTGQPSIRTGKISLHPCSTYPFSPLSFQPPPLFLSCRIQGMRRFHCLWNYVRKGRKGEKINYFFDREMNKRIYFKYIVLSLIYVNLYNDATLFYYFLLLMYNRRML